MATLYVIPMADLIQDLRERCMGLSDQYTDQDEIGAALVWHAGKLLLSDLPRERDDFADHFAAFHDQAEFNQAHAYYAGFFEAACARIGQMRLGHLHPAQDAEWHFHRWQNDDLVLSTAPLL